MSTAPTPKRNRKNFSLRIYPDEFHFIHDVCSALSTPEMKIEPAFLLVTAAVEEATFLGFPPSCAIPGLSHHAPPSGAWLHAPDARREESCTARLTITGHPLSVLAIRQAAQWANVPPSRFVIGSLWRFAAKRRQADPDNPHLQALDIPSRYFTC